MDADDIALPERLSARSRIWKSTLNACMVGSRVIIIDPEGSEITVMGNALSHEEIVDAFLANQGQMSTIRPSCFDVRS